MTDVIIVNHNHRTYHIDAKYRGLTRCELEWAIDMMTYGEFDTLTEALDHVVENS